MPLVRFEVKNEYKLGVPELYKDAAEREDSKGILDGVAAAGLVGVLRQLGDLTEFGGEVFHGLQEQVISTASRSHRLMTRLQHVEAALSPVEKASLSHTSHIHFAYTPGSEWHPRIRDEPNHFIYTDLPQCIMNSYEECREPPRLQLLDRFDSGGPGSCLKKYSDPTFFWKASGSIASKNAVKLRKDRKASKQERRRSCQHSGVFSHSSSIYNKSGRIQVSPLISQGQASSAQTVSSLSTPDLTFKSEIRNQTDSFESRDGTGFNECVFRPLTPMQADEAKPTESSSRLDEQMTNTLRSDYHDEQIAVLDSGSPCRSGVGNIAPCSSYVSWDEKKKIVEPMELNLGKDEAPDMCEPVEPTYLISATVEPLCELSGNSDLHVQLDSDDISTNEQLPSGFKVEENLKPPAERNQFGEVDSETDYYVDALNIIESELEMDCDYHCQTRRVEMYSSSEVQFVGNKEQLVGTIENCPPRLESPSESYSHQDDGMFHGSHDFTSVLLSQNVSLQHSRSSCNYPDDGFFHDLASPRHSVKEKSLQGELFNLHNSSLLELPMLDSMRHARSTCQCFDGQLSHDPDDSVSPQYLVPGHSLHGKICNLHDSISAGFPLQDEYLQLATSSCAYPEELVSHRPENSVLPESIVHEYSLKNTQVSSVTYSSPVNASFFKADTVHGSRTQSEVDEFISSGAGTTSVMAPPGQKITGISSGVGQVVVESSGALPETFWTNGGLTGHAPSKPPDCNSSNNLNGISISTNYIDRFQNPICKADEPSGKLDSSLKLLQCDDVDISEADRGHNQNVCLVGGSSFQSFHSGLHSNLGGSKYSLCEKADYLQGHVRNGDSQTHSETKHPVTAGDVNTSSSEFENCNASKSTVVSGLGRSLLMVGFQKFHSSHDGKPESDSPVKICEYGNGQYDVSHHSFPIADLSKQLNSPKMSPPPSPPLEHTNTSFQPLHSYLSSRLKLAYPDGAAHHNGALDAFPSFQLVPEPASSWHDIESDSDDGTFCRSHPCLSGDFLSHLSDSSSELWESGDSLQAKDHALYDGLCGASSESFSSSPKYWETARLTSHVECKSDDRQAEIGIIQSHSGTVLDPPVLGSINPFLYPETKTSANLELSESFKTPTPTPKPPPLPPLQWWLPNPQLNSVQDQKNSVPASLKQFTNSELLGSAILQPAKAVTEKLINTTKLANSVAVGEQQLDKPMLNGNKDITKTGKGGKVDEEEDFLQQIRAKSSNLRHTNTIRPACKPAPTASFKITAILEKANAIRKAVASDDGEDSDTWSDT